MWLIVLLSACGGGLVAGVIGYEIGVDRGWGQGYRAGYDTAASYNREHP